METVMKNRGRSGAPRAMLAPMTVRGVAAICADCGCAFGLDERRHYVRLHGTREKAYICTSCVARGEYRDEFTSSTMREELQQRCVTDSTEDFPFWTADALDGLQLDPLGAAIVDVINRRRLSPFSPEWHAVMESAFATWLQSKFAGVALTIVEGPNFLRDSATGGMYWHSQFRDIDRQSDAARACDLTIDKLLLIAGAMSDGVYIYLERAHAGVSSTLRQHIQFEAWLTYTEYRNFFAFDLGADYLTACTAAFSIVSRSRTNLRWVVRHGETPRERWWI